MTTAQYEGILTHVDDNGNEVQMYPDVKTDTTLSVSGKPADAAVVGRKLSSVLYIDSFDSETGTLVTKSADYTG